MDIIAEDIEILICKANQLEKSPFLDKQNNLGEFYSIYFLYYVTLTVILQSHDEICHQKKEH